MLYNETWLYRFQVSYQNHRIDLFQLARWSNLGSFFLRRVSGPVTSLSKIFTICVLKWKNKMFLYTGVPKLTFLYCSNYSNIKQRHMVNDILILLERLTRFHICLNVKWKLNSKYHLWIYRAYTNNVNTHSALSIMISTIVQSNSL